MSGEKQSLLSSFYRKRTYWCGDSFQLVSIVPRFKIQDIEAKKGRGKNKNVSREAQKNLNKRNAKKNFRLTVDGNFEKGDLFLTCTYKKGYEPKNITDAKNDRRNLIRRVRTKLKSEGKDHLLKYVAVTEYREATKDTKEVRFHHHIIINNIIDRDDLEALWTKQKGKKRVSLGRATTNRVRTDGDYSKDRLAKYMCGYGEKGDPDDRERDWTWSRNLKRPKTKSPADYLFHRSKLESLGQSRELAQEYFEKKFPDYFVTLEACLENAYSGYHYYLKLEKKRRGS